MADEGRTLGSELRELRFPERNRRIHGGTIKTKSGKPAGGDGALEVDVVGGTHGVDVRLQEVLASRQKTVLIRAQPVDEEGQREAHPTGIAAVEGRQVTRHRDGDT